MRHHAVDLVLLAHLSSVIRPPPSSLFVPSVSPPLMTESPLAHKYETFSAVEHEKTVMTAEMVKGEASQ